MLEQEVKDPTLLRVLFVEDQPTVQGVLAELLIVVEYGRDVDFEALAVQEVVDVDVARIEGLCA